MSNPIVFFDITIGGDQAGRIEMELRKDIVPITAENFRCLCTGEKGTGKSGKLLHFKSSQFHSVIQESALNQGSVLKGGDFINGNGTGSESIYGKQFNHENFKLKHDRPGILSMVNTGTNTNGSYGSLFNITTAVNTSLDGKNVVFGLVTKGMDVVKKIENVRMVNGKLQNPVVISNCGELK